MATKDISDKQVCEAYLEYITVRDSLAYIGIIAEHQWPYEILQRVTGQPEKVCYRACERAERRGFIEYGTSLRSGWLTEKGKSLLIQ